MKAFFFCHKPASVAIIGSCCTRDIFRVCESNVNIAFYAARTGYKLGTGAALTVLQGGVMQMFISVASTLGLFMIGGMGASMVRVTTPLWIPTGGLPIIVQTGILNAIAPGILPLALIVGTFLYITRGKGNVLMKAVVGLTLFGLALGAIGIIGTGGLIFGPYVAPK